MTANGAWGRIRILTGLAVAALVQCQPVPRNQAGDSPPTEAQPMQQPVTTKGDTSSELETATLAGGCFWCTEAIFQELEGVVAVQSGYSGGHLPNPTYAEVCTGQTGHAEAVQITFDPKVISYRDLLEVFFTTHDPTTLNRQGADVGTQYRSAIFTHSEAQQQAAREVIREISAAGIWDDPVVTEVTPFTNFYRAEEYHQDYFARNPKQGYCRAVIAPKVARFREKYRDRLKSRSP